MLQNSSRFSVFLILLVTARSELTSAVELLAQKEGFRVRAVASVEAALEWLSMQQFNLIVVDQELDPGRLNKLLETGWKYYPLMSAAVVAANDELVETWSATAAGARVFSGEDHLFRLTQFILSIPRDIELTREQYNSVLVVEDLDSPREIITSYIESLGFKKVFSVGSAKGALEMLEQNPNSFFCVLADIKMPAMNGIELTQRIRQTPSLAYLPVVILTAEPTEDHLIECVRAGATGFLAKPPKKVSLLRELEKAKRIVMFKYSARLCEPEEVEKLSAAIKQIH